MNKMFLVITILLIKTSLGGETHPFSGKWDLVEASHRDIYKKEGVELPLVSIEFRSDKMCVLYFESATGVKATIENRFVAGFEEVVLIHGEELQNSSVEIYRWSHRDRELILVQEIVVGGSESDPPATGGLEPDAADLLTKLSKIPQRIKVRLRLKRSAEQGEARRPATAEEKSKGSEKPKPESEGRSK